MTKQTVLIIFGGQSSEHEVSIASARNVVQAIDRDMFETVLCYIDRRGHWRLVDEIADDNEIAGVLLQAALGGASFMAADGRTIQPDVALPVLHGKFGEDGTVQGLLELMQLPYVGCHVGASALAMDKMRAKTLLEHPQHGIVTAPWLSFTRSEDWRGQDMGERIAPIGDGPWFVKPSQAGSSVGVSKVSHVDDISTALELAFEHDDTALIEKAIIGHEVEVAVLGNGNDLTISQPGEIIPGEEFYSYDDKYSEQSTSQTRLQLSEPIAALHEEIRQQAGIIYQALGCDGLARVDFFVTDAGKIYFNEINTMPGFTNISMYPKMMEAVGVKTSNLISRLLRLAQQ